MALWNRGRAGRADRAVGARGRAPSPEKLFKQRAEAEYQARREREREQWSSLESAAQVALRRLESCQRAPKSAPLSGFEKCSI
jgi:hypothetical protein